jgi:hypothetical protein
MSELSIHELEIQHGEVLPERETLGLINFNWVSIQQQNESNIWQDISKANVQNQVDQQNEATVYIQNN